MNPTLTQLAHELRDAILRWKAAGLIRQAASLPAIFTAQKNRTLRRASRSLPHGMSKHDPRRYRHLTPEQKLELRREYRRNFYRNQRRQSQNSNTP